MLNFHPRKCQVDVWTQGSLSDHPFKMSSMFQLIMKVLVMTHGVENVLFFVLCVRLVAVGDDFRFDSRFTYLIHSGRIQRGAHSCDNVEVRFSFACLIWVGDQKYFKQCKICQILIRSDPRRHMLFAPLKRSPRKSCCWSPPSQRVSTHCGQLDVLLTLLAPFCRAQVLTSSRCSREIHAGGLIRNRLSADVLRPELEIYWLWMMKQCSSVFQPDWT